MLSRTPLHELLEAFSSSAPTPGGGSASAMTGALGASLLIMVASLPRTRHGSDEDRRELDAAKAALSSARDALTSLIDEDAAAYDQVTLAYRAPKTNDAEKEARRLSIQRALRRATETPLAMMAECAAALGRATAVASHGNRSASSDVGVAIALLDAACRGAALNAAINLDGLSDAAYVDDVRTRMLQLSSDAVASAQDAMRRNEGEP